MSDNPTYLTIVSLLYFGGSMDAKLSFLKSSSPNVTGYRVKYGNSDTNLSGAQDFDLITGVTFTGSVGAVTVTGLDPAMPWYFQVYALNAFGVESTGSNIVNTAAAPAAPSQLSLVSLM